MKDDLITQTIKPEYPPNSPLWLTASAWEWEDWLKKWRADGCPTLKTMPTRDAAARRIDEFDKRRNMVRSAYRKLDK